MNQARSWAWQYGRVMALVPRPFPPALAHGEIREILPNLHFVTGTLAMPSAIAIRFSRNMTVVKEGQRLVLVNAVRLDDAGLAALDALGKVTDVLRIAGNHGMDDPFYKDRYGCKVWALRGQRYTAGFDADAPNVYLEPDVEIDTDTELPIAGARLHLIRSKPVEAVLLLPNQTLISGDCLQNWEFADEYFNWFGKTMMRVMGFIKPRNVGPGWLKQCKPPKEELKAVLDLDFVNVVPAHGKPVIGKARDEYRPAVDRAAR